MNALDFSIDLPRVAQRLEDEIKGLAALGFMAEQLDLRNYFDNGNLAEVLKNYDMVWITGGNTFILAKAFRQSGFDKVFEDLVASGQLVYGGYSAAFCVLAKSLHGIELVDVARLGADGLGRQADGGGQAASAQRDDLLANGKSSDLGTGALDATDALKA